MTEAEWLESDDPVRMFTWLCGARKMKPDKVHRLFAACSRRIQQHQVTGEVAEQVVPPAECESATVSNDPSAWIGFEPFLSNAVSEALCYLAGQKGGRGATASLLRCLIVNPFRPVTLSPTGLTPTVAALGDAAYWERLLPSGELDPVRMAALADALEEAGCTDADILGHMRGPGPHLRGCWALDLILGRS
jgi:hypothetical protein